MVNGQLLAMAPSRRRAERGWHRVARACAVMMVASVIVAAGASTALARSKSHGHGSSSVKVMHADGKHIIEAVSCPSTSLCVAVDDAGNVLTSAHPAGGASRWKVSHVDGSRIIYTVSCASASLCVGGDLKGNVVTSTHPLGGKAAWKVAAVNGGRPIYGMDCITNSRCVGVDYFGNDLWSSNPTGGPSAWGAGFADYSASLQSYPSPEFTALSCPNVSVCYATDYITDHAGNNVVTLKKNASGQEISSGGQKVLHLPGVGISCPSASLCVAVSGGGRLAQAAVSTHPSASQPWKLKNLGSGGSFGVSCASSSLCAIAGGRGVYVSTNPVAAHWKTITAKGAGALYGMSCPSKALCVAGGTAGKIVALPKPAGIKGTTGSHGGAGGR